MSNFAPYYARGPLGQEAAPSPPATESSASAAIVPMRSSLKSLWGIAGTAAVAALAYHGYRRNNSVGWAVAWALLGGLVWPAGLAVAFAQGFGQPAVQRNRGRRSRRIRR